LKKGLFDTEMIPVESLFDQQLLINEFTVKLTMLFLFKITLNGFKPHGLLELEKLRIHIQCSQGVFICIGIAIGAYSFDKSMINFLDCIISSLDLLSTLSNVTSLILKKIY